jgi:hypothetical protein
MLNHAPSGDSDYDHECAFHSLYNSRKCPPASIYNDRKGLLFRINFQPLLPPLKEGEKRRKNTRAQTINTAIYLHKGAPLSYLIGMAYQALKCIDLSYTFSPEGVLEHCDVEMKYTIGKTQFKKVMLESEDDYTMLLEEATKKAAPEIKIHMTELKVHLIYQHPRYVILTVVLQKAFDEGDNNDQEPDDDEAPAKKKKVCHLLYACA